MARSDVTRCVSCGNPSIGLDSRGNCPGCAAEHDGYRLGCAEAAERLLEAVLRLFAAELPADTIRRTVDRTVGR